MKKVAVLTPFLFVLLLVQGCGVIKPSLDLTLLEQYIDALQKLQSGFEIGITYETYGSMLIDITYKKNKLFDSGLLDKEPLKPWKSQFETQIQEVEEYWYLLKEYWERKIREKATIHNDYVIKLLEKYDLLEGFTGEHEYGSWKGRRYFKLWRFAEFMTLVSLEVARLQSLYKEKKELLAKQYALVTTSKKK